MSQKNMGKKVYNFFFFIDKEFRKEIYLSRAFENVYAFLKYQKLPEIFRVSDYSVFYVIDLNLMVQTTYKTDCVLEIP